MPNIYKIQNPLKIYEFFEVVSGSSLEKHHATLDLGCGCGFQTQVLARYCKKVIGLDIDKKDITIARKLLHNSYIKKKVGFFCSHLEQTQLSTSSLDRVFSFCVLEHITDVTSLLTEVVRLLKPGGELHISVDSLATVKDLTLKAKHKKDFSVVRYYTRESLREQLEAVGLKILEIFPILKCEFAHYVFENQLRQNCYKSNPINSFLIYKRIRNGDKQSKHKEGVILVARAQRIAHTT